MAIAVAYSFLSKIYPKGQHEILYLKGRRQMELLFLIK
jgi:hypothetical protein